MEVLVGGVVSLTKAADWSCLSQSDPESRLYKVNQEVSGRDSLSLGVKSH